MGIYDRDYMREKAKPPVPQPSGPRESKSKLGWLDRLRFKLYLLFRRKGK